MASSSWSPLGAFLDTHPRGVDRRGAVIGPPHSDREPVREFPDIVAASDGRERARTAEIVLTPEEKEGVWLRCDLHAAGIRNIPAEVRESLRFDHFRFE